MPPQLDAKELASADRMLRAGTGKSLILVALRRGRARRGLEGPGKTAVYQYLAGNTHNIHAAETRGRKPKLTPKVLRVLDKVRCRLQRDAGNEHVVTWDDISSEGVKELRKKTLWSGRKKMCSPKTVAKHFREKLKVTKRPARARIARTRGEEDRRLRHATVWQRRPASWWRDEIHAYIDNKTFVIPMTQQEKKRHRQSKVTYHLRKSTEGGEPDYVVPKTKRMLTGMKTMEVTAAVARGRIIMWYVVHTKWSGEAAATMYKKLGEVLRRTWGHRTSYRLVEDGDRKGYHSGKGKAAKQEESIVSWTLPPRTPQWMPLDFCLWNEIEQRVLKKQVIHKESKKQYSDRLRHVAMALPSTIIDNCLASMHQRIKDTVVAKGRHTKRD
jgi:hypothetical protein